jgi:hypothetical protein
MDTQRQIDPAEALDKFFQAVREEALANPKFGRRLLEAIGYSVIYRGEEAINAVDPVLVAMQGYEEFRRTFLSMRPAEIKKVGKSSGLLVGVAPLPTTVGNLVDLLWERARQRLHDLYPQKRFAAE